jgi:hypothetical protein
MPAIMQDLPSSVRCDVIEAIHREDETMVTGAGDQ